VSENQTILFTWPNTDNVSTRFTYRRDVQYAAHRGEGLEQQQDYLLNREDVRNRKEEGR